MSDENTHKDPDLITQLEHASVVLERMYKGIKEDPMDLNLTMSMLGFIALTLTKTINMQRQIINELRDAKTTEKL